MKRLLEQRYLVRKNLLTLIGFGFCCYFCYHLIQGERSYLRMISLQDSIVQTTQKISDLQQERQELEVKVTMLRPDSINKDLLEERARLVLGFRHEGEKEVLLNPSIQ
jgi:cell division protein FtsB